MPLLVKWGLSMSTNQPAAKAQADAQARLQQHQQMIQQQQQQQQQEIQQQQAQRAAAAAAQQAAQAQAQQGQANPDDAPDLKGLTALLLQIPAVCMLDESPFPRIRILPRPDCFRFAAAAARAASAVRCDCVRRWPVQWHVCGVPVAAAREEQVLTQTSCNVQ